MTLPNGIQLLPYSYDLLPFGNKLQRTTNHNTQKQNLKSYALFINYYSFTVMTTKYNNI